MFIVNYDDVNNQYWVYNDENGEPITPFKSENEAQSLCDFINNNHSIINHIIIEKISSLFICLLI